MAIITHADIADHTGRTFSTAQQAALSGHIAAVEAFVKRSLLDWTVEAAATVHAYDGDDTRYLWLKRYCSALTAVAINDTALANTDYRLVNGIMIERLDGGVWNYDPDSIEVTGAWGFTPSTVPVDFKLLLVMLVAKSSDAYGVKEVASESIGKVSFSYLQSAVNSDGVLDMLWRQWAPVGVM